MILYRLLLAMALPILLAQVVMQSLRGQVPWVGVMERLGGGRPQQPQGVSHMWLHGASLGELASARGLLEQLLAAHPGCRVIVTSNTGTSRRMVRDWGLPGVQAALAPFDVGWCLARFKLRWRPTGLILLESELWPGRMQAMDGRPIALIGARISAGAAARWQSHAPMLMRDMLMRISLLSAQDDGSEQRFLALGLPQGRLGPRLMLKAHLAPERKGAPFAAPAPRAHTVLAASTHPGDDGPILDAFQAARATGTFLHLIVAPRHPDRAAAILGEIAARGLSVRQRSKGQVPVPDTAVHLADTLGEMDHWYAMAGVTVIGGTFSDRGGHTPYEPAAHGSAILHGPDVANFSEAFAALDAAGGAVRVSTAGELTAALATMTEPKQAALAEAAVLALAPDGRMEALVSALLAAIPFELGSGDRPWGAG
jgi:3-deoxy-D-manno-octulosonic-acid transferase